MVVVEEFFMQKLSLEEVHVLLKKFKYVFHDDNPFKLSVTMNDEGLIVKLKSSFESVMMFPFDKNQEVVVNEDSILLYDRMNWKQIFSPLIPAKLFK